MSVTVIIQKPNRVPIELKPPMSLLGKKSVSLVAKPSKHPISTVSAYDLNVGLKTFLSDILINYSKYCWAFLAWIQVWVCSFQYNVFLI